MPVTRAATLVSTADPILITGPLSKFVSRGGDKLDGALRDLGVETRGKKWLDAGASTGGFTDRLLQGGAEAVVAVDVGYGQLDWKLRSDDRVTVMERTNVRDLTSDDLPWMADGIVADLSFISLDKVLGVLAGLCTEAADLVLLVKPQFEVGRGNVGKRGVVRDPLLWEGALVSVVEAAGTVGLGLVGATVSDLKGPAGNVEFFVHLQKGHDSNMQLLQEPLKKASS
jgi:23S rRNA (cytidine1920-2'-O)/16S rRNA (cytidine1409-2'-O)-methyltransferase